MTVNHKAIVLKITEITDRCKELTPSEPSTVKRYACLYEEIEDKAISEALVSLHRGFDFLFTCINKKKNRVSYLTRNYETEECRASFSLFEYAEEIKQLLDEIGYTLILDSDYSKIIKYAKKLLPTSGCIVIPDGFVPFKIKDTSHVFTLSIKNEIVKVGNSKITTLNEAKEQIIKCNEKIGKGDYSGAITNSRSLLESVFKKIYRDLTDNDIESKGDLLVDWKKLSLELNLHPEKQADTNLQQVLRGLTSIIQGLAALRNTMSDGHSRTYKPEKHHAVLLVNAALTITEFLFGTYEHRQNIKKKKQSDD